MGIVAAMILLLSATAVCPLGVECPRGPGCTPCTNFSSSGFLIFCGKNGTPSGPRFRVEYRSQDDGFADVLEIKCVAGPEWSDFHLGTGKEMRAVSTMSFVDCDLPARVQLASVVRQLLGGHAAEVEADHEHVPLAIRELRFNSYGKLRLSALVGTTLAGFTNCLTVDLSHNGLRSLPDDLLHGLVHLTTLNLGFNDLYEINPQFLVSPSLRTLVLQGNNIPAIGESTFARVPGLETLDLSKNRITEMADHSFDALRKLRTLNLRENGLISFSPSLFNNLKHLADVNLSYNNFLDDFCPSRYFSNNKNLKTLDLSHNKRDLVTLCEKFLSTVVRLNTLKLNDNGIRNLPRNLLLRAPWIRSLTFSGNNLEKLPDGLFDGYFHYHGIDLLNFSRNSITHISSDIFKYLRSIEELDLSYNRIKFIATDAFTFAHVLSNINLSYNQLTFNDSSTTRQRNMESETYSPTYNSINYTRELNFNNNNISVIHEDWLMSESLTVLMLRNNQITRLSHLHLSFHSEETVQLDLRDNQISIIDLSGLESPEFSSSEFVDDDGPFSPVVSVQLANNPLECDCTIYHLLRYYEKKMGPTLQRLFEISIEGLTCAGPPERLNTPVKSLNSKLLHCRVPRNSSDGRICPGACDCSFRVEDGALLVDCSHRGFAELSVDFKPGSSRHTELNLTGNFLKKIPVTNSLVFDNVTVLSLTGNQITDLSLRDLSKNLRELYLDGNNLTQLDGKVIEFLTNSSKLERLTLHGNPWKCDCDTMDFFYFIQSKQATYTALQSVTCNSSNTPIFKMSSAEICPPSLAMIIGSSMAAILLLTVVIAAGLYYRYETEIKVWLFAHRLLPWFVNEADVDRDKVYDAFVSYSHQDEDFVVNELVPKLEEGPHAFKLCIHYRDWLVGEFIAEQIARSVEESRRTVVVLSRNFLESEWGRMEFRTAHCNALQEGRARVIVIIYGDIGPVDELEPELRSYLRTNTYVQWGDRWFWEKLRYALPHPADYSKRN